MHLHQQRRAWADRTRIVGNVSPVCRPHLNQPRAGLTHDIRNTERAADFDQLAARDNNLAAGGQCTQHQQHRGGVVVHNRGRLGAGQLAQNLLNYRVTVAAPAAIQVVLQAHRQGHGLDHRPHGFVRQHGTPEVGVQHGACQVEHGSQLRLRCRAEFRCQRRSEPVLAQCDWVQ